MRQEKQRKAQADLIVIGGGAGGVICLYYARKVGLDALLLEKQDVVGGLWSQLPAWQDIQINPIDWTLGDIPIAGADQASIAANIRAWVDKFHLAPAMLLNTPVTRAKATESGWTVSTPGRTYRSKYLVAATGAHNRPFIPDTDRSNPAIREYHSSALRDPTELSGKDVIVVGGGASAYDLLELCLEHKARRIVWVYRSLKWMMPTRKPKHIAGGIRGLAKQQMLGVPIEQMNQDLNQDLRARYEKFGLQDILPEHAFDLNRDQLIPGRRAMIENFRSIERHRGRISGIFDRKVQLSSGARIEADLILWGTGYELDLSYFDLRELAETTRIDVMAKRCGSIFRSLDAPNLFFLAPGLLETSGSTPWAYAHASRSIVSHIQGKANLDTEPVSRKINHFDLARFLAARDPENYPPGTWESEYRDMAMNRPEDVPMPIP